MVLRGLKCLLSDPEAGFGTEEPVYAAAAAGAGFGTGDISEGVSWDHVGQAWSIFIGNTGGQMSVAVCL